MDWGRIRRGTVALLAAYAVALQAFFAVLIPATPAVLAGPVYLICAHDADDAGDPARSDRPCAALCAAMGHGIAGPMPPDVVVEHVVPRLVTAMAAASEWVPPPIALGDTHAPRGPPLA